MDKICLDEAIGIIKEIDTSKMESPSVFDEVLQIAIDCMNKQLHKEMLRYAFSTFINYNYDAECFKELADRLEHCDGFYSIMNEPQADDEGINTIFQMLIIIFGSWGCSPRSGWIEDTKGCSRFIHECVDDIAEIN